MKLILIRHAKAGERDQRRYPDDRLRPLTSEGRREQRLVARALRKLSIGFDHLLTSPLVRARETAEITAREMKFGGDIAEIALLGEDFSIDGLIKSLSRFSPDTTVCCVGHEPDLGKFAGALLHQDGDVSLDFKKSAVLGIEFPNKPARGSGTLLYFMRPNHLSSLLR